jgi:hypothetical protein
LLSGLPVVPTLLPPILVLLSAPYADNAIDANNQTAAAFLMPSFLRNCWRSLDPLVDIWKCRLLQTEAR